MAIVNFKNITTAVYSFLNAATSNYTIERNTNFNRDPSTASIGNGWIGIYKDSIEYIPLTISNRPWQSNLRLKIEYQKASYQDDEMLEDALETNLAAILEIFNANKTLGGTVSMTNGYAIEYKQVFDDKATQYIYSAIITINAETRS